MIILLNSFDKTADKSDKSDGKTVKSSGEPANTPIDGAAYGLMHMPINTDKFSDEISDKTADKDADRLAYEI